METQNEASKKKSCCKITKTRLLLTVIILTTSFFLVELIVGYLTKSNALVADSFHMLSDIISLIIGLSALRFSKKNRRIKTHSAGRALKYSAHW